MTQIKTLAQLVAKAESGGNQWAVRFEPAWKAQNYGLAQKWNKCDEATSLVLASCSWGLFQIMGDNLYELGLKESIGEYLNEPMTQTLFFSKFISQRGINITLETFIADQTQALNFCHHYNGSAQTYYDYLWTFLSADGYGKAPPINN